MQSVSLFWRREFSRVCKGNGIGHLPRSGLTFHKEAVFWYEEMYNEVHDDPVNGPHHLALLEQARDALIRAEREVAEANEQSDDEDEDYDNDDSGDGDDVDGEDNNNNDEDNEYQDDRDGEQDVGNRVQMVLANNIETGPASSQQASMV